MCSTISWMNFQSNPTAYKVKENEEEDNSELARKAHTMCLTRFHPRTILFRRDIGKRMKEIADRFRDIDEERRRFELRAGIVERQTEGDEWRHTSSVVTEHKVYGRDQDKEKIVEFLVNHAGNSDDLSIYPIVGIGGLGKTTLAQLVYNDDRVSTHFDLKIWVCVFDNFSIERILQSIIESTFTQSPTLSTLESLQKKVQEVLRSKRYLLVLDDVWNDDHIRWEKLKYLLECGGGMKGASILVTSRLDTVASIMGTYHAHHLLPLSADDNWSLFKHHAFGPNKEERAELVAIGKEIVKKCVGSPLASKALGSLLRFKSEEKQWLSVKESKFWDILEDDAVMRALRISYFNLKLPLRRCFSFCAIYPEDYRISREQLIHLWMANGLIKSRGNLEVEDVGNEVWNELYQKSFFQEVEANLFDNITFKLHDLFRDLAQSIMGEECVASGSTRLTNMSSRVHHISVLDYNRQLNLNMVAFNKLESLRTFIELCPSFRTRVLPAISSVRALGTSSSELSSLKNLTNLRYLSIDRSYITTLPMSITSLQKLQVLKLESCSFLSSLPKHLTQLHDLRHLVISYCGSLVALPPKIGELKCLKTLSTFIVKSKPGYSLAELRDLQLRGKLYIKGLENVQSECDARDANLLNKKGLNRLYLSWDTNGNFQCTNVERVLEALKPHSNLKSFGMRGYKGIRMPSWMGNIAVFSGLVDILLYDCKNCVQLPPFGKLPHLTRLCVCEMEYVKHIDDDLYDGMNQEKAFKSLKRLNLHGLPNLERILRHEGIEMLPLLSRASISRAPKLELPGLPSVEKLRICGLNYEDVAPFPEAMVQNMPHMKSLRIECFNKLKVLPVVLGSLSELQHLEIYFCDELESFPEHVLQGLRALRTLEIMSCEKLKSLSEGVRHLTNLECLRIIECPKLVTLPSNMSQLSALRELEIFGNRILPEGLPRIPSLRSLSLIRWSGDSLPEWLGDLTSLQQLEFLTCPELRSLPSTIRRLTNLQKLCIDECPKLEKRCKRVTGKDWQNIAHIPEFEVILAEEKTFCEKIGFKQNMRDSFQDDGYSFQDDGYRHFLHSPEQEFDEMVNQIDSMVDQIWVKSI